MLDYRTFMYASSCELSIHYHICFINCTLLNFFHSPRGGVESPVKQKEEPLDIRKQVLHRLGRTYTSRHLLVIIWFHDSQICLFHIKYQNIPYQQKTAFVWGNMWDSKTTMPTAMYWVCMSVYFRVPTFHTFNCPAIQHKLTSSIPDTRNIPSLLPTDTRPVELPVLHRSGETERWGGDINHYHASDIVSAHSTK
jgi:hypothetical protein